MHNIETILAQWYRDTLQDTVSRASAAVAEQVEHAVADLKARTHELEAWFAEHFHKAPVAHDTELHNALRGAVDELARRIDPPL